MCELDAPDVFTVPKHGQVEILTEQPPEQSHDDVRRAVQACPTQALGIKD